MAIYHCSCKVVSRGKGRSAVASSAYRGADELTNEYDGRSYDYTKKEGVVYSEIMLCENAPKEYQNREILWNEVEKVEKGSNARLAREYEVALPRELDREEQITLTRTFVKENFVDKGMCADFAIHDKGDGNPHAHIMITVRPIEKDGSWGSKSEKVYLCKNEKGEEKGFTAKELSKEENKEWQKQYDPKKQTYKCKTVKANDWDSADFLKRNREAWAGAVNKELEKKNIPERVDHRSLKEQGIERIPTIHVGPTATNMEREAEEKGIVLETKMGNKNREILKKNEQLKNIKNEIYDTERAIGRIQVDMGFSQVHEKCNNLENYLTQYENDEKAQRYVLVQLEKIEKQFDYVFEMEKKNDYHTDKFYGEGENKVAYLDFHVGKTYQDFEYIRAKAQYNLTEIEIQKNPQEYVLETAPEKHKLEQVSADPKQTSVAQPVQFDVENVAEKLAGYREAFVKATVQSEERTSYEPNPIYERQAVEIAEISKAYKEQVATIQTLRAQKEELGTFAFREKKALDNKIFNFVELRNENEKKLRAFDIKDPSKADEAIKIRLALAEQEKIKAEKVKENIGASGRAIEAKKAFIDLAKTVPEDKKEAVLKAMKQYRVKGKERATLNEYTAIIKADKELDDELRPKQQERTKGREKLLKREGRGYGE